MCLVGEILTIHHLNKSSELDHSFFNFLAFLFIYFLEQGKSCQKLSNSSQKSFNCIFFYYVCLLCKNLLYCVHFKILTIIITQTNKRSIKTTHSYKLYDYVEIKGEVIVVVFYPVICTMHFEYSCNTH